MRLTRELLGFLTVLFFVVGCYDELEPVPAVVKVRGAPKPDAASDSAVDGTPDASAPDGGSGSDGGQGTVDGGAGDSGPDGSSDGGAGDGGAGDGDAGDAGDAGAARCDGADVHGDYRINTAEDAARYAGCVVFTGSLFLGSTESPSLDLPLLETIHGGVYVDRGVKLTSFALPALTTVEGPIEFDAPATLTSVDLPMLTTVDSIDFHYLDNLASVNLPSLTTVGAIGVAIAKVLRTLTLPAVTKMSSLSLGRNPKLKSVSAPMLTSIEFLGFGLNNNLATLDFPALVTIEEQLNASDNPNLRSSTITALLEQLTMPPATETIMCGNADGAACPCVGTCN